MTSFRYYDTAWRETNAFWYCDAGTWREIGEVRYYDSGNWRTIHRRELKRPASSSTPDAWDTRTNPTNAFDTDNSTHVLTLGTWNRTGTLTATRTSVETFTFAGVTTAQTYNTLKLYISSVESGDSGINSGGGYLLSSVKYEISTDSGSNYTQMYLYETPASGSVGPTTTGNLSYSLSPSQTLANLRIKMTCVGASAGGLSGSQIGNASSNVYDIFTVGTY